MSALKDTRLSKRMTQEEAALALGVSLRSYKSYENEKEKEKTDKYKYLLSRLEDHISIDEKHGVLTLEEIKRGVRRILGEYEDEVTYAVLYGAYAQGKATRESDVKLLISTRVTGLRLADMRLRLEDVLRKRVSILERRSLVLTEPYLDEVLMHGVRVY